MDKTIQEADVFLKKHNINPSHQRIKIFEYLLQNRTHPTVDEIFKSLMAEIKTLSKTTVYNTLKLFIEKEVVKAIVIEDNEVRYDANVNFHGHFKCLCCNTIYDFNMDDSILRNEDLKGFQINEQHLYIKGICKACLNKD